MKEEEIIIEKLKNNGVAINDIYDLVNTKNNYTQAIPTLIELLEIIENDNLREGIIRALTLKEAKGIAGQPLIKLYNNLDNSILKWTIGNAFETIISDNDLIDVLEIIKNPSNGVSRQMFILSLKKVKSEKIEGELMELLLQNDESIMPHIIETLGHIKSKEALPTIKKMLTYKNRLVQRQAIKAIKKIEQ